MDTSLSKPIVILGSGQSIAIDAIFLSRAEDVSIIRGLYSEIEQNSKGFSTGIGFIGSPTWVLGASAISSLLDSVVSSSMNAKALQKMGELRDRLEISEKNSRFFSWSEVKNLQNFDCSTWMHHETSIKRVQHPKNDKVNSMRVRLRLEPIVDEHVDVEMINKYMILDQRWVFLQSNLGQIHLRWDSICGYRPPQ